MKTIFACTLFLVGSVFGYSQESKFLDGYVVTISQDTLFGGIKDRKLGWQDELTNKIHIKLDNGRVKKIKKKAVAAYKRGSEVFVRTAIREQLPILKTKVDSEYFLVKLVSGSVEIYKHYFNDQDSGIIDSVFFIRSKNNNTYKRLPVLGFKKVLKTHFKNPSFAEKLKKKRYRYADIPALVHEFNLSTN